MNNLLRVISSTLKVNALLREKHIFNLENIDDVIAIETRRAGDT